MENEKITQTQIESKNPEYKRYCILINLLMIILIIIFVYTIILSSKWEGLNIDIFTNWPSYYNIYDKIIFYLISIWIILIPALWIYFKSKWLISQKCVKQIILMRSSPFYIFLILFWACLIYIPIIMFS